MLGEADLEEILEYLEDENFVKDKASQYEAIQDILRTDIPIGTTIINRLLAICVNKLKNQKSWTYGIFGIISLILKKVKAGRISADVELLPSLLATLNTLKTSAQMHNIESLVTTGLEVLALYPDNVLNELMTLNSANVINVIDMYSNGNFPEMAYSMLYQFINRILKALPHDRRITFVKENLSLWFHTIIPSLFSYVNIGDNDSYFETLELLTNVLVEIDYSEDSNWHFLLECICNPGRFPLIMKTMLLKSKKNWDGLWKVCIRLLKLQITRSISPVGSPINSMLPVVETAFKMDVNTRCLAFKCWDVLIDNFHIETNEVYVTKRLKLLIIPLLSNNAKVEQTALAKFNTWWHLICKFQSRLDKYTDTVLVSFLQYCFGKHVPQKQSFVPGFLTSNTKKTGVEMFIEMAGHLSCNGCVNVEKLNGRVINTKVLVDHWNVLTYSLKTAIVIYNEDIGITLQQITCLWKSFNLIVCELPDNSIRKDLFEELLTVLDVLLLDSSSINRKCDTLTHLISSMFTDEKIMVLFNTRNQEQPYERPLFKVLAMLINPVFNIYYMSYDIQDIVLKFKPIFKYILKEKKAINYLDQVITWMTSEDITQDSISFLWTTLVETLYESHSTPVAKMDLLLLWPLKRYNLLIKAKYSTVAWYKLLNKVYFKVVNSIQENINNFLWSQKTLRSNIIIKLYALLVTVKHTVTNVIIDYEKCLELLMGITNKIEDYIDFYADIYSPLTASLVIIMKRVSLLKAKEVKSCVKCVKNILMFSIMTFQSNIQQEQYINDFKMFLLNLESFFCKPEVSPFIIVTVDIVMKLPTLLEKQPSFKDCVLPVLKSCASNMDENIQTHKEIKKIITKMDLETVGNMKSDSTIPNNKFTTPEIKAITRKAKKREATIVNTVVDNGEEYIVVKSNWKFNPRKLTENQKEKLQRKREDIPALYQDLSQSQDEFKLTSWKNPTDSQDSSSTNSKSTNACKTASNVDEVSNILKNIPSCDVVPKIIENIMTENIKKDVNDTTTVKVTPSPKDSNKMSTKDPKSPRMALKDRVFKNVRSLIEKSNVQRDDIDLSESLIQIENMPKTPISKVDNNNLVNSAPPNISTERPSRVKRKPKKFDDVEIFALKRGRRSSQSDSQPNIDLSESPKNDTQVPKEVEEIKDSSEEEKTLRVTQDCSRTVTNVEKQNDNNLCKDIDIANSITSSALNIEEVPDKQVIEIELNKRTNDLKPLSQVQNEVVSVDHNIIELDKNIDLHIDAAPSEPKEEMSENKVNVFSEEVVPKIAKTPKSSKKPEGTNQNSSYKRSNLKTRIEKELAIDTVEGHPLLNVNSEKRITRKNVINPLNNSRRKSLTEKLNKSKTNINSTSKTNTPNTRKKERLKPSNESPVSLNSENRHTSSEICDDLPLSEDVIESSQDSTFTTVSTISNNKNPLKKVQVVLEPIPLVVLKVTAHDNTQKLLNSSNSEVTIVQKSFDSKDDTDIPQNKTVSLDKSNMDTDIMDTESIGGEIKDNLSDVIMINDEGETPIVINTGNKCVEIETQEIAEADTEPVDYNNFNDTVFKNDTSITVVPNNNNTIINNDFETSKTSSVIVDPNIDDDMTKTISESAIDILKQEEANTASSPFKDEEQRKKDFLDNTLEISPIKSMSPVREQKTPSPETSSDYVVIKLSSPVQSNGEPFEKCDSPEIFTEDKVSPDKRDVSPPRDENTSNIQNGSPSSSLSLKKNRPQVRSGGRAAQMLGLCVPDRLQTIKCSERSELEDPKKSSPSSTPARRNLRIMYNSVAETSDNSDEKEDSELFLKFTKSLPTADCSPSVPILKRKLAEIIDDATVSPVSKRKRVSFHDPPVSTTISVQKYIEPCGIRSPQNSAVKRLERQNLRSQQTTLKSQKRLDNAFKLDKVLTKAVESFVAIDLTNNEPVDDTPMSLDDTPAVEIVRNCDLNDVDPICPELLDCKDPIDNIASDLSSPTMKDMFLRELEDKIATIGDLARMTELEVNRLCIKAPKVKTAKSVLSKYCSKTFLKDVPKEVTIKDSDKTIPEACKTMMDSNTQTNDIKLKDMGIQTTIVLAASISVQTDKAVLCDISSQTEETGNKSTKDIITTCLAEKPDFVEQLADNLEISSKLQIAEKLPFETLTQTLLHNVTSSDSKVLITKILEKTKSPDTTNRLKEFSFLQDYLCERYESKDLILLCSQLLAKIHDKPGL